MDSKLLHCFLSVVDHRNVTAAAAALHLTQPALSKKGGAGTAARRARPQAQERQVAAQEVDVRFTPVSFDLH